MKDCGCAELPSSPPSATGPNLVPTVDACPPDNGSTPPGSEPITDEDYQCSIGVRLQPVIDRANRLTHELGFRPYRVFLVWAERNRNREFVEVFRKELIPVRLVALDAVDLDLSQAGLQPEGGVSLREVSPLQTTEDELRGFLDGSLWGRDDADREFFYEVVLHSRCEGDPAKRRRRFVLGAEPHFDGPGFQFRIGLVDQEIARGRDGVDRTSPPTERPRPRIIP